MNCTKAGCDGKILFHFALNWPSRLKTPSEAKVSPCNKCGKLHWIDGQAVIGESGHKSFLSDNGKKIIIKNDQEKEISSIPI